VLLQVTVTALGISQPGYFMLQLLFLNGRRHPKTWINTLYTSEGKGEGTSALGETPLLNLFFCDVSVAAGGHVVPRLRSSTVVSAVVQPFCSPKCDVFKLVPAASCWLRSKYSFT